MTVFELLTENGLTDFYRLSKAAGVRTKAVTRQEEFAYLDNPTVRERLVDFADERETRVTFRVPTVHCIACVWLLENLFRLNPGIGHSQVNFPRKEVFITLDNARIKFSELLALLSSLGYAPELKLSDLENRPRTKVSRRLWLQLGVAGFAFGNIMLLSISSYLGLDGFSGPALKKMFGYISLALACPVLIYSAADYWRAAWLALRQRILTIDVPIAVGIAALTAWSTREVFAGRGAGYFDSLAGLLFFLLCGKLFQQKTYDRLAFDRDYKSFFPLVHPAHAADSSEERISLSQLQVGDRLIIRNGELIPSDSRLVSGPAMIDYSFVTGESEPVEKTAGRPYLRRRTADRRGHRDRNGEGGFAKLSHFALEPADVSQGKRAAARHADQPLQPALHQNCAGDGGGRGVVLVVSGSSRALIGVFYFGVDRGLPVRAGAGRAVHPWHGPTRSRAPESFPEEPLGH